MRHHWINGEGRTTDVTGAAVGATAVWVSGEEDTGAAVGAEETVGADCVCATEFAGGVETCVGVLVWITLLLQPGPFPPRKHGRRGIGMSGCSDRLNCTALGREVGDPTGDGTALEEGALPMQPGALNKEHGR